MQVQACRDRYRNEFHKSIFQCAVVDVMVSAALNLNAATIVI